MLNAMIERKVYSEDAQFLGKTFLLSEICKTYSIWFTDCCFVPP